MNKDDYTVIDADKHNKVTGCEMDYTGPDYRDIKAYIDSMGQHKDFKIASYKVFFARWGGGCFMFRLFGVGLHFKDTTRHRLLFSERNGWGMMFGKWRMKIIK